MNNDKQIESKLIEEYDRGFTGAQLHHHTLIDQYIECIFNKRTPLDHVDCIKHLENIKHIIRVGYWDASILEE